MSRSVIIDAIRTPIGRGKPNGVLAGVHPVDLEAAVLRGLVERTGIDPADIDDVIGGAVSQVGEMQGCKRRNCGSSEPGACPSSIQKRSSAANPRLTYGWRVE